MKKILIVMMGLLLTVGGAQAQQKKSTGKGKGKKGDSPVVDGRQKIRETDYLTFDYYTQFNTKEVKQYYTPFDYSRICTETSKKTPEWREMEPVIRYLQSVSRATMTVCAMYAVKPEIEDVKEHKRIAEEAKKEALAALECFDKWKVSHEMKNKVQYKVAEVDYRYFKGANYYNVQSEDEVIHVGLLLYFGSKKKAVFDADTTTRTFVDIKFFPNDATIVESWETLLDEVSDYLKENDRKGVLLTGYSDNNGTEAYCMGLSKQRAMEVKKALMARGIDASRIEIVAKGTEDPLGDNDTYEGRIKNNRVSIKLQ